MFQECIGLCGLDSLENVEILYLEKNSYIHVLIRCRLNMPIYKWKYSLNGGEVVISGYSMLRLCIVQ